MKVYVIKLNGTDTSKTEQSLLNNNLDYTVLPGTKLNQVWSVPKLENFKGVALVITSNVEMKSLFDASKYLGGGSIMCHTVDRDVCIMDCSKGWFRQVDSGSDYSSVFGSKKCNVSDELRTHFNPEVSVPPTPEPAPEPAPEPSPEPEVIVEPDPSDFNVETWTPQDEFPNSGE